MLKNPLEQFDVGLILNLYQNINLTNFSVMMCIIFFFISFLFWNLQSIFVLDSLEFILNYLFIYIQNNLKDNLNIKKYSFIFLFYFIFLFIVLSNLIGMTPYVYNYIFNILYTHIKLFN